METLLQTVRNQTVGFFYHSSAQKPSQPRLCVRILQDVRSLSSGKPAQHAAEMEADLEKAEGMIRFLFNDVQLLKDGRHLQAEQMYRRCTRNKLIFHHSIIIKNYHSQTFYKYVKQTANLKGEKFKPVNVRPLNKRANTPVLALECTVSTRGW